MNEDEIDRQMNEFFKDPMSHLGTAGTVLTKEMWEATYGPGSYELAREIWPEIVKPKEAT